MEIDWTMKPFLKPRLAVRGSRGDICPREHIQGTLQDFLNDIFDIENKNVNTPQKTDRVEDTVCDATGSGLSKRERQSSDERFVFNPTVNAVNKSSSFISLLDSALRKIEDVSPCTSKQRDFIRSATRKPVTTPAQPASKTKRQRKFPGPAGLLPDRQNMSFCDAEDVLPGIDSESACEDPMTELCSQGACSGSVLQEEPWQQMLADLGSQPPGREVLDTLNIASVKRKGAARLLVGRKVPFLAAVLHHIDVSSADPVVVLRDHTGEMHGTLHRDVWEQFGDELTVGSVLVLRNVGVLSTGLSARRHYLNITSNNVATIYSASQGEARVSNVRPLSKTDFMKTIEDWQAMVNQAACNSSVCPSPNPQLFDSFQPMSSSPSCSLPPTNKLQNNAFNIRNLAKAFNNNQYLGNPATPMCTRTSVHNSSSSVNIKDSQTFNPTTPRSRTSVNNSAGVNNQTFNPATPTCSHSSVPNGSSSVNRKNNHKFNQSPAFQPPCGKYVPNSVPSNENKISQSSSNSFGKFNNSLNNNSTKLNQKSNNLQRQINQLKRMESTNSDSEFSNRNFASTNMNCSVDQQSVDMFMSRENTQKSQFASHPNNWTSNLNSDRFSNSGNFATGKYKSCTFQPKKPRFSSLVKTSVEGNNQAINLSTSNITICSGTVTEDEKSVVASVLDGLDEDSLFSDDF